MDPDFESELIVAIQRLSEKSGMYPLCFRLKGVAQRGKEPVASGSFGEIYQGTMQKQVVCIKTLRVYEDTDVKQVLKELYKEAILWGHLRHHNLVTLLGVYFFKNKPCLVAPWMSNGQIDKYLEKNPGAPRLYLADDVAQGLHYLHKKNIVHGDLKAPNILVDEAGRARVADFSISLVSNSKIATWTSKPAPVSQGGTMPYQAPEILFGMENGERVRNSEASNIYAWGCVNYEIFMKPYYEFIHPWDLMTAVKAGIRPKQLLGDSRSWQEWGLTKPIWALMEDCWREAPLDRPTISEIINRLQVDPDQDQRPSVIVLSPVQLREKMAKPLDQKAMSTLDRVLEGILGYTMISGERTAWTRPVKLHDIFISDPKETDVIIPIMGCTGSVKSTFINALMGDNVASVGHDLQSHTAYVEHFTFIHPDFPNCRITVIDTPSFDDTDIDSAEILRHITLWLAQAYDANMKIAGVIYLHEITRPPMHGGGLSDLNIFNKLCGSEAAKNIKFVITKWGDISANVGDRCKEQLKDEYWKYMLDRDSRVYRFDTTQHSARHIVNAVLTKEALSTLLIQRELAEFNNMLGETEVGRYMGYGLPILNPLKIQNDRAVQQRLEEDNLDVSLSQKFLCLVGLTN